VKFGKRGDYVNCMKMCTCRCCYFWWCLYTWWL